MKHTPQTEREGQEVDRSMLLDAMRVLETDERETLRLLSNVAVDERDLLAELDALDQGAELDILNRVSIASGRTSPSSILPYQVSPPLSIRHAKRVGLLQTRRDSFEFPKEGEEVCSGSPVKPAIDGFYIVAVNLM